MGPLDEEQPYTNIDTIQHATGYPLTVVVVVVKASVYGTAHRRAMGPFA